MYAVLGLGQELDMIGQFGCLGWFCRLYTYRMDNDGDAVGAVRDTTICQDCLDSFMMSLALPINWNK